MLEMHQYYQIMCRGVHDDDDDDDDDDGDDDDDDDDDDKHEAILRNTSCI